jgi:hypothetical protein
MFTVLFSFLLLIALPAEQADAARLQLHNRTIDTELNTGLAVSDQLSGTYYLQLATTPTPDQKEWLAENGVELRQYLPRDFWFGEISEQATLQELNDLIIWIGVIQPEDKLSSRIVNHQLSADLFNNSGDLQVIVRPYLYDQAFVQLLLDLAAQHDWLPGEISERFGRVSMALPLSDISLLTEQQSVRWIEPVPPPKSTFNDGARVNMNVNQLQEPFYNLRGSDMTIGVWDGGTVTTQHPDFSGRLTLEDSQNTEQHATHVAGTMAGDGTNSSNNGGSQYQWRGMATEADLHSWDWDDAEDEYADAADEMGLSVANNSWGYGIEPPYCDFYGDYAAFCVDVDLVVPAWQVNVQFAAGNERGWNDCGQGANSYGNIPPPGTAKNIITIGAINSNNSTMTGFSSWGPVDDGRIKPDLCAPGCQTGSYIKSTLPATGYGGNGWCGTSMAAPAASGVVTLLQQAYRARYEEAPYPSLIKGLLIQTAEDLGNNGPDYQYGWGGIDALAAIDHLYDGDFIQGMIFGDGAYTHHFTVPAGTDEIKVTLVWDDTPGTENAERTLVTDLNLRLTAPDATEYQPWVTNPNIPSQAAQTGNDSLNNVEQVSVQSPQTGEWTATVNGDLPMGYQLFSLVLPHNDDLISLQHQPADTLYQEAGGSRVECTITGNGDVNLSQSGVVWYDIDGDNGAAPLQSAGGNQYYSMIPAAVSGPIEYYLRATDISGNQDRVPPGAPQGLLSTFVSGSESVSRSPEVPREFALLPLYPNPFNPSTTCAFSLRQAGHAEITVYDLSGRKIKQLLNSYLEAGVYQVLFQGNDLPAGLYFIRLRQHELIQTRKALLVK